MVNEPIRWIPRSYGINDSLGLESNYQGSNMFCDKNALVSAPELAFRLNSIITAGHKIHWVRSIKISNGSGYTFSVSYSPGFAGYKLWTMGQTSAGGDIITNEVTGPGFTGYGHNATASGHDSYDMTVIGDDVLLSTASGILNIDPVANTYTVIASSPQGARLTTHLSRVVAVLDATVSWCVPGNPNDWTTTTNGAGSATMVDHGGRSHFIGVIDNHLIILREHSFYHGYITGNPQMPYRLERIYANMDGPTTRAGVVQDGDDVYYKGHTNFFRLREGAITAIGSDIWNFQLFDDVMLHSASISHDVGFRPQNTAIATAWPQLPTKRIHFVPITYTADFNNPEYIYNTVLETWEINQAAGLAWVWSWSGNFNNNTIATFLTSNYMKYIDHDNTRTYFRRHAGNNPAQPISIVSAPLMGKTMGEDMTSDRLMVVYFDTGQFDLTFTVTCVLNGTLQSVVKVATLGNTVPINRVMSEWVDIRGITGQFYKIQISGTPTDQFVLYFIDLHTTAGGIQR
jgi:hypothetical protein